MKATVSTRGRFTLPAAIRRKDSIEPSQETNPAHKSSARTIAAAVLTLLLTACATTDVEQKAATQPFPPDRQAALERALDQSWKATTAPGVVVGIWIPGEGSFIATRGTSNAATGAPMRVDDHFRIGSNTKTFTVTLLLLLADEKKLGLDDPVSKFVNLVPNGQNITLRMLANMTAGLASYTEDEAFVKALFANWNRVFTPRELVEAGVKLKPTFPPGTGWHYSNTNTVLLGIILEQVGGKPIGELLAEKIYKPLGLKQTSYPTSAALPAPYAYGITEQTLDGKRVDATHFNPSWGSAAGQMVSTVDDFRIWVPAYTTGTLLTPQMQKERVAWVTFPPNKPEKKYGMGMGSASGWLGHTGELPGYNTAGYYLPEKKATIVVFVNSDVAVGDKNPAPEIFKALARVVTPGNVPQ